MVKSVVAESDVIPFARAAKDALPKDPDQLDEAGQTILQILHRAAGVAEENSRRALETAQKLWHQLRTALLARTPSTHRRPKRWKSRW